MTVPATARRAGPFDGTGAQTAFPFSFRVFSSADIRVTVADADGIETVQTLTTHYTVAVNSNQDTSPGGTVTMLTAPAVGSTLVITGATAYTQTLDLPAGGSYSPSALEAALDRIVFQVQQLAELTGRSLTLPATAGGSTQLPVPEAGSVIGWDDPATGLRNIDPATLASVVAYANWDTDAFNGDGTTTVFALRNDPGSVHNCDVAIDGVAQTPGLDFTVSGTLITFTSAPPAGTSNVVVRYGQALPQGVGNASGIAFDPAGSGAARRDLQTVVREAWVSVAGYGATGDGTTDDTLAFQRAIAALPGGGRIRVPRGWHRITSPLPLHSGLIFEGEGCTNLTYGTPTNDERPSHIFIDSDSGVLFDHPEGVQLESVVFEDISFGARLFPNTTPRGTAVGFSLSGSHPIDAKHLTFTRCQFANFGGRAIRVDDPTAPSGDPDWNAAPATLTDCTFYYNGTGIEINADNADMWTLDNVGFFLASGGIGINLKRSGMLQLRSCYGGGGTMVKTSGSIRDNLSFLNCQYEAATAFLQVADTMATQQTYRPTTMDSCTIEAPILIDVACHLITKNCRFVDGITNTVAGFLWSSICDSFLSSTTITLHASSAVKNFITNGEQLPVGVRGQILNGQAVTRTAASPGTGTWKTGDISWNSAPAEGKPAGWLCVSDGTPGGWLPMGQTGYRTYAGNPTGVVVPYFVGEELYNSTAGAWYKSKGTTAADWLLIG